MLLQDPIINVFLLQRVFVLGNIFTRNISGKILLEQKPQTENPKHASGKIRTITWAIALPLGFIKNPTYTK